MDAILFICALLNFPLVNTAPIVVLPVKRFSLLPIFQSSSQLSPKDVPSAVRSPAIFFPVDGSKISPSALTTTTAAIRSSPSSTAYIPRPDFIARSMPQILPTVAPVPAPTLPQEGLPPASAFSQAAYPIALSGRTVALP